MVINATHLTINRLAEAIVEHSHTHFSDGLVMRAGLGWESSNVEAVYSWLASLYRVDTEDESAPHHTVELFEADFSCLVEQKVADLALLLRRQSDQHECARATRVACAPFHQTRIFFSPVCDTEARSSCFR